MELILISESKLKIMLSPPDMARYELEATRMDCADAHTRAAFRHIFDDARAEVGFDTAGSPLFVQLYASPEGGCEIFVTKLEGQEPSPEVPPSPDQPGSQEPPCSQENPCSPGERRLLERVLGRDGRNGSCELLDMRHRKPVTAAYVFGDLGHLLALCRRLSASTWEGLSHAYLEDTAQGSYWYLLLESREPLPAFTDEYGESLCAETASAYLSEHARLLRQDDAAEVLGGL